MDPATVATSPGNPAEDGFITVTKKKRDDIRAVETSENNKIGRRSLRTECEIPHPYLWSKLRLYLFHVYPNEVSARNAEYSKKNFRRLFVQN
jgi:hypothetical protein